MTLSFIKKINDTPAWHRAKQYQYKWIYHDKQSHDTTQSEEGSDGYHIAYLKYIEITPKLKDVWHLSSQLGDIYLINASDYLQARTGIYPYHQEIHTQEWLILCIEKELKNHWPQLQIKHLELLEQLPQKMHIWQLELGNEYLYLAASEQNWHKVLKKLRALPKPKLMAQNIPLHLPVLLGQTELNKKEYNHLKAGDIIYLDRSYFNSDGEGFCAVGEWQIELYYKNQHFYFKQWDATSMSKIENPYDEIFEDDDMDDEYSTKNQTDEIDKSIENADHDDHPYDEGINLDVDEDDQVFKLKADRLDTAKKYLIENDDVDDAHEKVSEQGPIMEPFKQIPVLLNFSLGQLKISLAELSNLNEGDLLPLASNDAAITIYANHLAVARGEIVMIDERLAVQITNILEK